MKEGLELTSRDKMLLELLRSYGLLSTQGIGRKLFPGVAITTVLRRLRKLEQGKWIARIGGLDGGGFAWRVTEKGAAKVSNKPFKRYFTKLLLDHDLKVSELRLALEGIGAAKLWLPEHEIRAQASKFSGSLFTQKKIIPDAIMSVSYQGGEVLVAVEMEIHSKSQRRYSRIFSQYSEKRSVCFVWYLVPTASLGKRLNFLWRKSQENRGFLVWSLIDDVLRSPQTARIHQGDHSLPFMKVWAPKSPPEPAHPMSIQGDLALLPNSDLSAESQNSIPALHNQ